MARLYHYTSGNSLLGIFQSRSLWATDLRFLNDFEELNRGLDIFEKFSDNLKENILDSNTDLKHLSQLMKILVGNIRRNAQNTSIHVVSFTKKHDDLSQWLAYCNSEVGYCIEFESDLFFPDELIKFDNCIKFSSIEYLDDFSDSTYSSISINRFKDWLVESLSGKYENISEEILIEKFSLKANTLFLKSIFLASSIKPVEFQDESEIRLLYIGKNMESKSDIRNESEVLKNLYSKPNFSEKGFREVADILVPYQAIPFNIEAVKKVTIGPTSNKKIAERGITEFRDSHNLSFDIFHSKCSLRRM